MDLIAIVGCLSLFIIFMLYLIDFHNHIDTNIDKLGILMRLDSDKVIRCTHPFWGFAVFFCNIITVGYKIHDL